MDKCPKCGGEQWTYSRGFTCASYYNDDGQFVQSPSCIIRHRDVLVEELATRTTERDAARGEVEVLRRALEAVEERLHDFTEGYECACDVSIGLVNCEFCQMTALLGKVQKARADAGGRDEE